MRKSIVAFEFADYENVTLSLTAIWTEERMGSSTNLLRELR